MQDEVYSTAVVLISMDRNSTPGLMLVMSAVKPAVRGLPVIAFFSFAVTVYYMLCIKSKYFD